MTREIKIRNISSGTLEQLREISTKYNYPSFNEFMLAQVQNIAVNDGLNLYQNQFAELLAEIKSQQNEILEMLVRQEISLTALNVKQDVVEELTVSWLEFVDDVEALGVERNEGRIIHEEK
ncbi:hypothetical protein [Streptococcus danieliae]|uniref:Uncharacterized protein n=1 Tax=Streptococcus danieliae TaxID=747656 RepID=A0A7X3G8V0_9STRE|nr:hypothetical protein [Streptococcus danieliae]MCU0081778.1 hypothetical protein [Streptococcus danieliae]MVX58369.1 hypothetical protein [Streptococcus danieliae]